jgi:serine/threonine protein kinase
MSYNTMAFLDDYEGQPGVAPVYERACSIISEYLDIFDDYLPDPPEDNNAHVEPGEYLTDDAVREMFQSYGAFVRVIPEPLNKPVHGYESIHVHAMTKRCVVFMQSTKPLHGLPKGTVFAIKVSPLHYDANRVTEDAVTEARWSQVFSNDGLPSLLPSVDSFAIGNNFYSVSVVASLGALNDLVANRYQFPSGKHILAKSLFLDIFYTVSYLHNHLHIAHLDIKPANVFIDENGKAILGDFGVTTISEMDNERECLKHFKMAVSKRKSAGSTCIGAGADDTVILDEHIRPCMRRFSPTIAQLETIINGWAHEVKEKVTKLPNVEPPVRLWCQRGSRGRGYTPAIVKGYRLLKDASPEEDVSPGLEGDVDEFFSQLQRLDVHQRREYMKGYVMQVKPGTRPIRVYAEGLQSSASIIKTKQLLGASLGTLRYMCPALRRGKATIPFAADVYSLGVTLFECVFQMRPYATVSASKDHRDSS